MRRMWIWVALGMLTAAGARAQTRDVVAEARTLAYRGERDEAIAVLRQRLVGSATDVDARLLLGIVLSWDGQYDEARSELERVLQSSPTYRDAIAALLNVELWSGRARVVAERSLGRMDARSRSATRPSRRSPASWPKRSLTAFTLSRSM